MEISKNLPLEKTALIVEFNNESTPSNSGYLGSSSNEINNQTNNQENTLEGQLITHEFEASVSHKLSLKDVMPQVMMSCLAHCIVIQAGINMAYSTILEDGLTKDFSATVDQLSWTASLVTIALPLGSFIVGPLMDLFGRKKICLASCIPGLISWIILIFANSMTMIYIARIIAGLSGGLSTVGIVYISEITHPNIRPMLLCFNSIFVSLGILLTYCLGVWLTWKKMAIVFLVLHIFIFFILFLIPESPYWIKCFRNKNSEEQANKLEAVLKKLNKSEEIYNQELKRISEVSQNQKTNDLPNDSFVKKCLYFYHQLGTTTVYKPCIILLFLFLFQQLTGTYVIIFYALSVFDKLGGQFGKGLNKYGAMVILGIIRFLISILTAFFSKKFGRRILLITSGLGMAFSMFFSAMYLYITSSPDESGKLKEVMADQKWLLLVIVLLFVCTSCLGFVIIPWTLIGELLPISVRGMIGGYMVSIAYIMMFGMIKGYPYIIAEMGTQGVFFFFSVTSLISVGFVYVFLPETLGKSFTEIERYFKN
ncbi:facilitated trehalose transporter Tret1-like [Phymastichus coffea]|uniref:facilitated trehalose transporter Tret1-like n=1 Tax=Phymastichus coffea TaxID=108790 RepID=UPI00273BE609|nr:facilitated trehalose transporter Tret1-like [Phymastichus coffea]